VLYFCSYKADKDNLFDKKYVWWYYLSQALKLVSKIFFPEKFLSGLITESTIRNM
jgi:hypothetical protein